MRVGAFGKPQNIMSGPCLYPNKIVLKMFLGLKFLDVLVRITFFNLFLYQVVPDNRIQLSENRLTRKNGYF